MFLVRRTVLTTGHRSRGMKPRPCPPANMDGDILFEAGVAAFAVHRRAVDGSRYRSIKHANAAYMQVHCLYQLSLHAASCRLSKARYVIGLQCVWQSLAAILVYEPQQSRSETNKFHTQHTEEIPQRNANPDNTKKPIIALIVHRTRTHHRIQSSFFHASSHPNALLSHWPSFCPCETHPSVSITTPAARTKIDPSTFATFKRLATLRVEGANRSAGWRAPILLRGEVQRADHLHMWGSGAWSTDATISGQGLQMRDRAGRREQTHRAEARSLHRRWVGAVSRCRTSRAPYRCAGDHGW
ncbi:hypothetical protein A0H81_11364 [Grifola frondosa]|uniref:Uncharacterized protein n=1 Tax=Grifola frondosa TaxID=5627 RepID=A0A1C7LVK4_GRIFR|nr:hypothetical protein A0H81_11364 [Grifola frondosa]